MAPAAVRDSVGNLPAELTSFVGRRHELSEAKALLASSRLLTLTGMGGVGKTRLARRLALEVRRAFPDGVWEVELAELHEPALVPASIATSLALHEPPGGWTIGWLQERLAGRHLLLLLDNCEHLIDACASTVDALLRACPDLHVLATSRQPLAIDGEQSLVVPPLPTMDPERTGDLTRLDQFDAARLFVERAGAVLPGFAIDGHNRLAVAELCHRLDGLPLALEFAARRVRALSPDQIVARLDTDARLSTGGSRIASRRQQSLRALVDWSYQLCSESERLLWCRLSVFTGSFDLEAAESCAGTAAHDVDLVDLVVGLVEKSVLVRESHDGRLRYRMTETIRDYGRERLVESGEDRSARRAHRDWYVTLTARAHEQYAGPDQVTWFRRLRQEHGDIRAALEFSLTEPDGVGPAVDILVALLDYWIAIGFISEGRHWLGQLLLKAPEQGLVRARALRATAHLALFLGEQCAPMLKEAVSLARRARSETELAWIAYTAATAAVISGDFGRAGPLFDQALIGLRAAGDLHGVVDVLGGQTVLAAMSDDLEAVEARTAEFLAVAEPLGERWMRSNVLWALGLAAWRAGDHRRAADLELESMRMRLSFDDRLGPIVSTEVLAWITASEGDAQTAAVLLGAAKRVAEAIGTTVQSFVFLADDHEKCRAQVEGQLGPAAFQAAFRRGSELRADQVIELVSGAKRVTPTPPPGAGGPPESSLTRREREIAELVAEGLSNKEIASRLVIAPRTAEGHVEHILVKLGFSSRTQIAAWVVERRGATP